MGSEEIGSDVATFFIIVPPGFEDLAKQELEACIHRLEVGLRLQLLTIAHGGLLIRAPFAVGIELNRYLKIPARILLRVAEFGCRDFPKLFKKVRNIDWSQKLTRDRSQWQIVVSSRRSRLKIKKRIEAVVRDGLESWLKGLGPETKSEVENGVEASQVFVRFDNDICTLSVDTTGEHLHFRGYRAMSSEAPIRENLAAGLIWALFDGESESNRGDWSLIDPMCGSGTLLLEAAALDLPNPRSFGGINQNREPMKRRATFSSFFGFDLSEKAISAAQLNAEALRSQSALDQSVDFQWTCEDLFSTQLTPTMVQSRIQAMRPRRAVVCNPPYGERIEIAGGQREYFENVAQQIERRFRPDRVGLIVPASKSLSRLRWPRAWKHLRRLNFENGGIPVTFHVFVNTLISSESPIR